LSIVLPVGISFYTFQTLSYTIDIYRRNLQPSRSLIDYLAFVSFFPQLVAGPIERASRLLPQFSKPRQFDHARAGDGCRLILWGLFKKIVVADRLAILVDQRYSALEQLQGPELAFATVCFAFQIYCDFSAYSDIAIGTAKLFSIDLMRNFAYPYFSQSISEFWRRWHISLSTWFRDYVFIPLGGSRTGTARRSINTLLTFLISGLWHGAAWQFVAWGGVNGTVSVGEGFRKHRNRMTTQDIPGGPSLIPRPGTALRMLITFTIVCAAWVFFRADTLGDALLIFQKIGSDAFTASAYQAVVTGVRKDSFARVTIVVLAIFIVVEWCQRRHICPLERSTWPLPLRWATYTLLIWTTLELLPPSGGQAFVYFEF
jgi:alginate O-acetyltransferase complex protein AlgI